MPTARPRLHLFYTDVASGTNRVTSVRLGPRSCSSETLILEGLGAPPSGLRHGGALAFGADGKLYVAVGDAESPSSAQSDGSRLGKILRVNDDGTVPADNPDPASPVFAKGVRDGVALAFDDDGRLHLADGGAIADSSHDELNRARAGSNLGWDAATGSSGGVFDDPIVSWADAGGLSALVVTSASLPNGTDDGIDDDEDRFGPDRFPGVARVDDNGLGECLTSQRAGQSCSSNSECTPVRFGESQVCEKRDDLAEYCPGDTPYGDDACGSGGTRGIDELDESYAGNLLAAFAGEGLFRRVVRRGADLDELFAESVFFDESGLPDCPTEWSALALGPDGHHYALATNGGANAGALYRIVHDDETGPREVSPPSSPFPLTVRPGATDDEVVLAWEDLRRDAEQPRDDGSDPLPPEREYTVWMGTLGSFDSHAPVPGFDGVAGSAVHGALRETAVSGTSGQRYFLVSARHANLNGSTGADGAGTPRRAFDETDLCPSIGTYAAPSWDLFTCGRDFTLVDEEGVTRSLHDYRGQVLLIDFTSPWCGPCNIEADVLENLYQEYRGRGVQMLTVLADEDSQIYNYTFRPAPVECRNWGDRSGAPDHTFPCLADTRDAGNQQKAFPKYDAHFTSYPTNVVIDRGLRVAYSAGFFDEVAIREVLDTLTGATETCLP
jgi:thiol-disulfide isomerase/thioredoxin